MKRLLLIVLSVVMLLACMSCSAKVSSDSVSDGQGVLKPDLVFISEVMADNSELCMGHSFDFVEICNGKDDAVTLDGYYLTDDMTVPDALPLAGHTVPAGGYVVITLDAEAPFHLSSEGESVYLTDGKAELFTLTYPQAQAGVSYDLNGACEYTTPGFDNNAEGYGKYLETIPEPELVINELLPSNSMYYAPDGQTYDMVDKNALVVKILHSPYANVEIDEINTDIAMKVPGIEVIYTYKDVPQKRFTMAGQTYPEPSPYDRLLLDKHVRFHGDAVAIVAGEDEKAVDKALKLIKVKYNVLPAVNDFRTAKDNPVLVHPEDNWLANCPVGADNKRNLCAQGCDSEGDVDAVLADCDVVLERTFHTKACHQAMMETFRTYTEIDHYGRLHVVSSTQIVFHARRILSQALAIPKSKIHVEKPRIGGGFGAKQSLVAEIYPAFVTWKTGKAARMVYTRRECQIAGSPRHEMEVTVKIGADKNGKIRALDVHTLSNTGAYGEHGPTTVGLSGHKSIPLYTGSLESFRFAYDVVYTNVESAGAYRGYGATQGIFAVESVVNELADRLGMDPVQIRLQNMVREGQIMPAYYTGQMHAALCGKLRLG